MTTLIERMIPQKLKPGDQVRVLVVAATGLIFRLPRTGLEVMPFRGERKKIKRQS